VYIYFAQAQVLHRNRNCKLQISTAPTKAKSREPAYSQALIQNKIARQRARSRESQAHRQTAIVARATFHKRWMFRKIIYYRKQSNISRKTYQIDKQVSQLINSNIFRSVQCFVIERLRCVKKEQKGYSLNYFSKPIRSKLR